MNWKKSMSYFESNETISSSLLTASVFQIPNDGVSVINIMDFIYYFFQFHPEWRRGIRAGTREEEVPIRLNTAPHFTPTESEDGRTFFMAPFLSLMRGIIFRRTEFRGLSLSCFLSHPISCRSDMQLRGFLFQTLNMHGACIL